MEDKETPYHTRIDAQESGVPDHAIQGGKTQRRGHWFLALKVPRFSPDRSAGRPDILFRWVLPHICGHEEKANVSILMDLVISPWYCPAHSRGAQAPVSSNPIFHPGHLSPFCGEAPDSMVDVDSMVRVLRPVGLRVGRVVRAFLR